MKLINSFQRKAVTMAAGTIAAQVIAMLSYPLIARIFEPSVFGQFSLFFVGAQVLSLTMAGRYEQAIVMTTTSGSLRAVLWLAMTALLMSTTILGVSAHILAPHLRGVFDIQTHHFWLLVVLAGAMMNMQFQAVLLSVRHTMFVAVSVGKVVKALTSTIGQVILALTIGPTLVVMMAGEIISVILTLTCFGAFLNRPLLAWLKSHRSLSHTVRLTRSAARRYIDLPKLNLPHTFQNSISSLVVISIITYFYSASDAGQYFMMHRISMLPAAVVSTSLAMVYFRSAVEESKRIGSFRAAFLSTFIPTSILAGAILVIFGLFAESLFASVLGLPWAEAGRLAEVYAPFTAAHLILSSLGNTNLIAGRQKAMLIVGAGQSLLFIGTLFFSVQQQKPLDDALRLTVLLVVPYLIGMCYWYWRLATTRTRPANGLGIE